MKTSEEIRKDLEWLGFVYSITTIAIEGLGIIKIASYQEKSVETKQPTDKNLYHGFLDGRDIMDESFNSFEECLVCNIAYAKGDRRGDAGRYFMKMIKS